METQKATAVENCRHLYRMIMNTGPREPDVSEVIKEPDVTLIHLEGPRLERLAEHFRQQINWSMVTVDLSLLPAMN